MNANQHTAARRSVATLWWVFLPLALLTCAVTVPTETLAAGSPQFNRDVRPILAEHCFACHGPDEESREAGLRLDRRSDAVEQGAFEETDFGDSEFLARILSDDADLVMPPADAQQKLTEHQKETLRQWVLDGATYEIHWAFQPPERAVAPEKAITPDVNIPPGTKAGQWPRNEIDRFVLARLQEQGLEPAEPAEPSRLFRRLHLDVTGLPPRRHDTEAFVADLAVRGEEALSDWIDRLMASPAWGEHRARYWLDAARYGDTHGLHFDNYREMWPYRDWVIRAFNSNQPFDEFTVEQIAGDLLPNPSEDQLIATGFQRCNITTNEGGTIDEENLANYAADRVQTLGWVYLAMTTNCAQCHDHKFDPLTTEDYYSLAAFFRNTTQGAKDGNAKDGKGPFLVIPAEKDRARWQSLPTLIADAESKMKQLRSEAKEDYRAWLESDRAHAIADDLPCQQLLLHLPLDQAAEQLSTEGEAQAAVVGTDQDEVSGETAPHGETATPSASEEGKFEEGDFEEGKFGPAPVMRPGKTLLLGVLGDFEQDRAFSYGAWIKPGSGEISGGIIARIDEHNRYRGWDLFQEKRRLAVHLVYAWPTSAIKVSTRRNVLKPGTWQHVFVSYDGTGKPGGIKLFVDGKPQALKVDADSLSSDASIRTATPLRVGQRSHSQVFEEGAVQDVRLYGRALKAVEVKRIHDLTSLLGILSQPAERRTDAEQEELFQHYLVQVHDAYGATYRQHATLVNEQQQIRDRSPITHIQRERMDSKPTAHVLMRGQYDRPGHEVSAAVPAALHPLPDGAANDRLGLARWLVDPANPLTARVTVNRFWQQLFGQGIVTTTENFGVTGARPSHPELLDWLAVDFQENGWDVKAIFKKMLMSATYRQAAVTTPKKLELDRDNRLLSRGPRFRMDAEMVRDHALAVSGLLCREMYGPGIKPYQPDNVWNMVGLPSGNTREYVRDKGDDLYRRSIYIFWKRMAPPPSLEAFNAPSREVCTVRRERTNTPLQALVTLNDPQFVEAARKLAERAVIQRNADPQIDDAQTVDFLAQSVLCRSFSDVESSIVHRQLEKFRRHYESRPEDAGELISIGESSVGADIAATELAAWTMICNQLMNLDEALNK